MKVAHLDTGRTWRGGQGQVLLLLRELRTRGVEQLLLAPDGPLRTRAEAEGFETIAWRTRGEIDLGGFLRARAALRAFAPDVAHAHSAHAHALGVAAARAARVPVAVVSRRVDFTVGGNPFSRLKYRMDVDRYFCISRGVMQAMIASGVPESALALVPSGVDFAEVRDALSAGAPDLRRALGLPGEAVLVGTVASLAPHKNHALLLEAAARVCASRSDVHFVWLGEGECRAALERRRAELGLEARVHMPGFRPDARGCLPQFDLFVLSSNLEGLCTSLLDAQVAGVPIVATAVGGVPEVVEDGVTGRLVHALEPAALAAAVEDALANPAARAAWASAARRSVERFSAARTAERSLEEYARALESRARGRTSDGR